MATKDIDCPTINHHYKGVISFFSNSFSDTSQLRKPRIASISLGRTLHNQIECQPAGNSDDGVDDKYNDPHGVYILMHSYALSWLKLHKLQVGGHHGKCRDMYSRPALLCNSCNPKLHKAARQTSEQVAASKYCLEVAASFKWRNVAKDL